MKENRQIHKVLVGSHLHGTATEDSDEDVRGVYGMPLEERLSPFFSPKSKNGEGEDEVNFELSHFARQMYKCNPTTFEIAFSNLVLPVEGLENHQIEDVTDWLDALHHYSLGTERYLKSCNGFVAGMTKRKVCTAKMLHHAARIHTHASIYARTGKLIYDVREYHNTDELIAIKQGKIAFPEQYTTEVEMTHDWHRQAPQEAVDNVVYTLYTTYAPDVMVRRIVKGVS